MGADAVGGRASSGRDWMAQDACKHDSRQYRRIAVAPPPTGAHPKAQGRAAHPGCESRDAV